MALKKEALQKIATLLKLKEADLETAIKDANEVEIAIADDLTVLSAPELEQRDTNQKNDGIKAGKEIGIKEVRTAAGLEESIGKDPAKVAQAIIDKANKDAKIEPDKKVTQLTEQVTLLQSKIGEKDTEIAKLNNNFRAASLDSKILTALPKNRASTLNDAEYLTLIKSTLTIEEQDNALIVKKGSEILRDNATKNPLSLEAAVTGLFTERKWIDEAGGGGRGGKDKPPTGVFMKQSELEKSFIDQGKSIQGQEFQAALTQQVKDNKDFKVGE